MQTPKRIKLWQLGVLTSISATPVVVTHAQSQAEPPASPVSQLPIINVEVARGLKHPWSIAFLPNGDFLISEKDGGLKQVSRAGKINDIIGLPSDVDNVRQDPRDNSGLFDVALHPRFQTNGLIYLAYASKGNDGTTTKLVRAQLEGLRLVNIRTLFEATPRSLDRYHYGGGILITPEHLYLTVGERHYNERDNPPMPVAQDLTDRAARRDAGCCKTAADAGHGRFRNPVSSGEFRHGGLLDSSVPRIRGPDWSSRTMAFPASS